MHASPWRRGPASFALIGALLLAGFSSTASAVVNVRVQPSDSGIATAYTLINEQRTFFGNVEGGVAAYNCEWNVNGTLMGSFTPSNTRYITIDHTFTTGGGKFIQLTCDDGTTSDSATINLTVVTADSDIRKKNSLIDNSLRYAYQSQRTGSYAGCFDGTEGYAPTTGMALIAFENHGHNLQSLDEDIYKPVVVDAIQCLMDNYAESIAISNQTCIGDPEFEPGTWDMGNDDNHGIRMESNANRSEYHAPFPFMAIVNSADEAFGRSYTVTSTNAVVNGKTLWQIAREMKDYFAWSMTDAYSCNYNSWRYYANYSNADGSVGQWPALALFEAELRWHIYVNPTVKSQHLAFLDYTQNANGACGYSTNSNYLNMAKTASCLIGHNWSGRALSDPNPQNAMSWMASNYGVPTTDYCGNWYGHFGCFYPMYAFFKAMKLYNITSFNGNDWEADYAENIRLQSGWDAGRKATYIDSNFGNWDRNFDTYVGIAMLAEEVADLPPVAEAGTYPGTYAPGQFVNLDGTNSYHTDDPAKHLIRYEWDFDTTDGLWWDSAANPPAGEGALGQTASMQLPLYDSGATYPLTQVVSLRVLDDGTPQMTDVDTASIDIDVQNSNPVAQTNGPWAGIPYFIDPGDPTKCASSNAAAIADPDCADYVVTFDGTTSYDPNSCTTPGDPTCTDDSITSFEWDVDGDNTYNEVNGDDGWPTDASGAVRKKIFNGPDSSLAKLRVTDEHAAQGTSADQYASVALAFATNYRTCWVQRQNRFVWRYGLGVTFENIGDVDVENLVVTLTSIPTNYTIVSDTANLGTAGALPPAGNRETACDSGAKTAEIIVDLNRRVLPTGNWAWRAEFDADSVHYVIPNLPPLLP